MFGFLGRARLLLTATFITGLVLVAAALIVAYTSETTRAGGLPSSNTILAAEVALAQSDDECWPNPMMSVWFAIPTTHRVSSTSTWQATTTAMPPPARTAIWSNRLSAARCSIPSPSSMCCHDLLPPCAKPVTGHRLSSSISAVTRCHLTWPMPVPRD